jgi:hypothetical protein
VSGREFVKESPKGISYEKEIVCSNNCMDSEIAVASIFMGSANAAHRGDVAEVVFRCVGIVAPPRREMRQDYIYAF